MFQACGCCRSSQRYKLTYATCLSAVREPVDNPQPVVCESDSAGSILGSPDHPAALPPQPGSVHTGGSDGLGKTTIWWSDGCCSPAVTHVDCPSLTLSWTVTSPERGPLRSRRWAALWTLWLIKSSSVFYTSVSPMLILYQVRHHVSCTSFSSVPSYVAVLEVDT